VVGGKAASTFASAVQFFRQGAQVARPPEWPAFDAQGKRFSACILPARFPAAVRRGVYVVDGAAPCQINRFSRKQIDQIALQRLDTRRLLQHSLGQQCSFLTTNKHNPCKKHIPLGGVGPDCRRQLRAGRNLRSCLPREPTCVSRGRLPPGL
jgi:hypothetical protein